MSETITGLPLAALRESPFNPRKSYPAELLRELAESIATQGVLQPIIVRPVDHTDDDEVRYEVVVGHRRLRASHLAKQLTIPALVRAFTDAEAAVAQIHENAKREDVNAVEEADALQHLHRVLGMAPGEIAAEVGRSISSVYNSLKLAKADESLRRAVLEQKLPPQNAYEVARLPWQLQSLALENVRDNEGEWFSYRDTKAALRRMFVSLDTAPFPIDVVDLVPTAGACDKCPKRAGNDQACSDLDPMLCLDMDCFAKKTAAAVAQQVKALRDAGQTVLEGDAAKSAWPNHWNNPAGLCPIGSRGFSDGDDPVTLQQLINRLPKKAKKPEPVHLVSPHDGQLHTFIRLEDARDVVALMQEKRPTSGEQTTLHDDSDDQGGEPPRPDGYETWTPAERLTRDQAAWAAVVAATLDAIDRTERTAEDLRLFLRREYELAGDFDDLIEQRYGWAAAKAEAQAAADAADLEFEEHLCFEAWLQTLTGAQLGNIITAIGVLSAIEWQYVSSQTRAARVVGIAERYGVDVLKAAGVEAPPPADAPAKKPLPKGVKYRDAATGSTWSGKGLQPKWLKAALAEGRTLAEFAA